MAGVLVALLLLFLDGRSFLDRGAFLAVNGLLACLLIGQLLEWRSEMAAREATPATVGSSPRVERLEVRSGGRVELIELARVVAFRGADDYAEVLLEDGSRRLHECTLSRLERSLPPGFLRVHRSWIVSLARVREWSSQPGGRAMLDAGVVVVPVGRTYRRAALERLRSS